MHGLCVEYAREYARTVRMICIQCACDMCGIFIACVWDTYVWNIAYTTCMEYVWDGIRAEQSWNNRGMTIWNNRENRPSPAKCLKRANVPNECLTKIARSRSTCGMVWNMYGIHLEEVWNYVRNMHSRA